MLNTTSWKMCLVAKDFFSSKNCHALFVVQAPNQRMLGVVKGQQASFVVWSGIGMDPSAEHAIMCAAILLLTVAIFVTLHSSSRHSL